MNSATLERRLALFSIVAAVLHFIGETWVHFLYGQFLPMLIVDYIAISLLLFAGTRSLQTGSAAGLLCGAWGFTFCLNYRTLFWRVEALMQGESMPGLEATTRVLAVLFFISMAAFATTLYLANPRRGAS